MKSPVIRNLIQTMREKNAPSIDGSYVLLCKVRSPEYEKAAHVAYTPLQIAAEQKIKAEGKANVVYFIRDEQQPAPYWISPYRQAIRTITSKRSDSDELISVRVPHVVFTVAKSRDSRKEDCIEVAIPVVSLPKKPEERAEYVLTQLRNAIAALLAPEPAAA